MEKDSAKEEKEMRGRIRRTDDSNSNVVRRGEDLIDSKRPLHRHLLTLWTAIPMRWDVNVMREEMSRSEDDNGARRTRNSERGGGGKKKGKRRTSK